MLLELRDIVFARWERYSRLFLSTELHKTGDLMNNMKQHCAIKDAALARVADRAATLLRRHFDGTGDLLLEWLAHRTPKAPGSKKLSRVRKHA